MISLMMFFLPLGDCSDQLVGGWTLISWEAKVDQETINPYGPGAFGYLEYNQDKTMVLMLMKKGRNQQDVQEQTGFFTYLADFNVDCDSGIVHHNVRAGSHPEWIGKAQKRMFRLSGDTLTIRSPELRTNSTDNRSAVHNLVWIRMKTNEP